MNRVVRAGALMAALMLLAGPGLAAFGQDAVAGNVTLGSQTIQFTTHGLDVHGDEVRSEIGRLRSTFYSAYRELVPSVPEPATWAIMMLGFGFAGSAVRRRRTVMPRVFA